MQYVPCCMFPRLWLTQRRWSRLPHSRRATSQSFSSLYPTCLWPMPCTPPPLVLHLASVTNTGGIAIDVWAMTPDFSLPRFHPCLCLRSHREDLCTGLAWPAGSALLADRSVHRGLSVSTSTSSSLPFTFTAHDLFSFLRPGVSWSLARDPCGPGISALVLAPARTVSDDRGKLVSDLPSTDVHNMSLQVLSVSNAPFPILASTFDHDLLLQYFIQTVQLLVMISSAWIASFKSFLRQ